MQKWTVILIVVIILLLILIAILSNYDTTPVANNYSEIETQMRKLWY